MARGLRPSLVDQGGRSLDYLSASDWGPACDALATELDDQRWQDGNARVLISDHWARYASLPWNAEISGDEERMIQAKLLLGSIYGSLADKWAIRVSGNRPNSPALVSAVPAELIERLGEITRSRKLKLYSVQPNLVASFNNWRGRMNDDTAWFASVDEGSLATIRLSHGRCDQAGSLRTRSDWTIELKRLRTMSLLGHEGDGRIYVDAVQRLQNGSDEFEWLGSEENPKDTTSTLLAMRGNY